MDALRELIGRLPIFGICLGHQLLGLALGFFTYKLKFGDQEESQKITIKKISETEMDTTNKDNKNVLLKRVK